ncbi:hypothetical protein [Sinomonas sp. R1AF57]|uniref:hypothetical protein n=1 Tax=Sinomonas sp. R1AF57 TaxID=2020377 RepID=UPI000B5FEE90|nr:hypothetical protein [Sinomonas sp. R1AF57]ASN51027.1 hypothetical protein CGQ25_02170 [Sinomonas sp. R1AF57]
MTNARDPHLDRNSEPRGEGAHRYDPARDDIRLREDPLHGTAHEPGRPVPRNPHDDEAAPEGTDVTPSSKGLGAVWGDAERTPNPGPVKPPNEVDQAAMDAVEAEYVVERTEDGERYLTPRDGDTEGTTTDEFPESP